MAENFFIFLARFICFPLRTMLGLGVVETNNTMRGTKEEKATNAKLTVARPAGAIMAGRRLWEGERIIYIRARKKERALIKVKTYFTFGFAGEDF